MSFQSMTWAVEQNLPAMQKIVLLMLANRTNHDSGLCFPSHDRLAKDCGMTSRSVINQIAKLEEAGFIAVIREVKNGVNQPNKYRLNMWGSERDSVGVVNEVQEGDERDSVGVVNAVHINQETETGIEPIPPSLAGEQQNCYDWAMRHPFWQGSITSISKFLYLYSKDTANGLKAQYQADLMKQPSSEVTGNAAHQKTNGNRKLTPAEQVTVASGFSIGS